MQKKGKVKFINKSKSLFYETVKERVENYFVENKISKHANISMIIKTVVFITGYFGAFLFILFMQPPFYLSLILWVFMGINVAGIGMSIMHDANHGAYSKNKNVNFWMGHTLNLAGGTVFNWKLQHNILHHTYTNIVNMDDDIDDKAAMRFSPHKKHQLFHKFQFIYAFFFYGLLTLYWAVGKDFVQYFTYTANGVNANTPKQNRKIILKIVISKIFYFSIFFVIPIILFHIPFYQVLIGFIMMHFVSGVILSVVFQLAHTVEGTSYPVPTDQGTIENCWAIHQMNTTVNFARKNKWISWYVGGLNFQVEHHLFPKICHVHYPKIAHIVKETANDFNVPYLENETFMEALNSHVSMLQKFGKLPNINEVIG